MVKKRREITDGRILDCEDKESIPELIGIVAWEHRAKDYCLASYSIRESFGKGEMLRISLGDVTILLNLFELDMDILFKRKIEKEFVQLSFLMEGEKMIYLKGREIFLEGGDSYLLYIRPLDGEFKILANTRYKEVRIKLSNSFLSDHGFTQDYRFREILDEHAILPITDEVMEVLDDVFNYNFKEPATGMYIMAKVFELLALQIRSYTADNPTKPKTKSTKNLKKLLDVKKMIDENLQMNFSLSVLSKEVGMSKSTLNREFVRVFGVTINQFSVDQKINRAKYLLLNTDAPIYQIAEEVGYKNATHFSAAFKREVGQTPRKFRVDS